MIQLLDFIFWVFKKLWRSVYSVPPVPPALNSSRMATTTELITNSIFKLEDFPDEILFKVLDYLDIDDLFICTHVSRRIREICNDGLLWHKKIEGKFVKNNNIQKSTAFCFSSQNSNS
jgi:hypothetical protein